MGGTAEDRRIRALRPAKPPVDPWTPCGVTVEEERLPDGSRVPSVAIFLAGAECPFTCVFCDLWRFTTDAPTPPGAIPVQVEKALLQVAPVSAGAPFERTTLKLYNASNFFDDRAVPPGDDEAVARLVAPFARVVVECHPRLVGGRAFDFAGRLAGKLEVAMGLETVHPEVLARLNKKTSVADFDRAAAALAANDVGLRAFVLLGAPFVPPAERVEWTVRSVVHALERGAAHVALIPVRTGNGEMERLERTGDFTPPTLATIEEAVDACRDLGPGVVSVDLWDLERFAPCPLCRPARRERLERFNLEGVLAPPVACACRERGPV